MDSEPANDKEVRLEHFASPADFAQATSAFLAGREIENGLLIGLTARLVADPAAYGVTPYLVLLRNPDDIVGVALMTPPWNLVLSHLTDRSAAWTLTRDVWSRYRAIPGVTGPRDASETFAAAWEQISGCPTVLASRMRIYTAETIIPPEGVPGSLRSALPSDRPLIEDWMDAFYAERNADEEERQRTRGDVALRFADPDGGWFLWYDDDPAQPVSLVGYAGPTSRGIRIGPVYTPPALRGRGYASAATAAVSQRLLDGGWDYCFLYTELTNHTANKIYPAIGYRFVDDADVYQFIGPTIEPNR